MRTAYQDRIGTSRDEADLSPSPRGLLANVTTGDDVCGFCFSCHESRLFDRRIVMVGALFYASRWIDFCAFPNSFLSLDIPFLFDLLHLSLLWPFFLSLLP